MKNLKQRDKTKRIKMKVKDFIMELQKLPQNLEIVFLQWIC